MSYNNTTAYQDREIGNAKEFGDSISKISDQVSEHISNLIIIISELDAKLVEAKKLLDGSEIPNYL